ncbi:MAG TPA: hypothetical protein VFE41_22335, partial [Acetobacteraceae bacterium]|nr:hypothetical protein [Acetobacteraceae bacterium]
FECQKRLSRHHAIAADSLQGIPKRQFLQSVTKLTQLFPNAPLRSLPPYWGAFVQRQWKIWYGPARGVIKQVQLALGEAQTASTRGDITVIAVEPYQAHIMCRDAF